MCAKQFQSMCRCVRTGTTSHHVNVASRYCTEILVISISRSTRYWTIDSILDERRKLLSFTFQIFRNIFIDIIWYDIGIIYDLDRGFFFFSLSFFLFFFSFLLFFDYRQFAFRDSGIGFYRLHKLAITDFLYQDQISNFIFRLWIILWLCVKKTWGSPMLTGLDLVSKFFFFF